MALPNGKIFDAGFLAAIGSNAGKPMGRSLNMTVNMSARVLVVDDEADSARIVADAIAGRGFEVVSTPNGREGLNVLHTMPIAGILLGLEMPVMNGWTMLDELRWQGITVPVIVMSHEANHAKLRKLLEEGAQEYLVKPLDHRLVLQKSLRHFPLTMGEGKRPGLKKEGLHRAGLQQAVGALVAQRGM